MKIEEKEKIGMVAKPRLEKQSRVKPPPVLIRISVNFRSMLRAITPSVTRQKLETASVSFKRGFYGHKNVL